MESPAEAAVDAAKDAAMLPKRGDVSGDIGGRHPAVGRVKRQTVKVGFVEWNFFFFDII